MLFWGSPNGFGEQGNIGKISKGTREHEPIFREKGNKTVQIRGRKHFDIRNKERRLFLRFYLWAFMYHCHWFLLLWRSPGGSPCSLVPFQNCPMFPHLFLICSPFIKFAYHLSSPSISSRKKKKKRKKTPKTKVIKEENRLYVTFSLCDTSSQAFQPNLQSFRVGWALELLNLNSLSQSS